MVLSAALLAFAVGAAPQPPSASSRRLQRSALPAAQPVLLFVTDGGRPDLFREFAAQGWLPTYARLQAEGAMGPNGMIPQLPTSSRVGWNTLATGAWGGTHGSINNVFTSVGRPMSAGIQFGDASPLEAETLPEAAERAGRRVLLFDWNSTDQPPIQGPTVNFWDVYSQAGVAQNYDAPELAREAAAWGLMFDRLSFTPLAASDARPTPHSPPLAATLRLFDARGPSYTFPLVVYDATDDGRTNYDRLEVRQAGRPAADLREGEWAEIRVKIAHGAEQGKAAGFYVKALELAPDAQRIKLFVTAVSRVSARPDDLEDALADNFPTRAGADGAVAWAGLIDEATYVEAAELTTVFNVQALPWLLGTYAPGTDLAMVGAINTDIVQHAVLALVTPGTPVFDDADRNGRPDGRLAERSGFLRAAYVGADRTLAAAWGAMPPDTVVFAASDHGFAPTWKAVYAPRVLAQAGLQPEPQTTNCVASERVLAKACWVGGAAMIYMNVHGREPQGVVAREDYAGVRDRIVAAWRELRDERGNPIAAAVFTASDAHNLPTGGAQASMSHPAKTGDVIVFLNLPYQFDFAEGGTPLRDTWVWWGAHGHLPQSGAGAPHADLFATFYAAGPGVRRSAPRGVRAVDVAPTIAAFLRIPAPAQSEGRVLDEIMDGAWRCVPREPMRLDLPCLHRAFR